MLALAAAQQQKENLVKPDLQTLVQHSEWFSFVLAATCFLTTNEKSWILTIHLQYLHLLVFTVGLFKDSYSLGISTGLNLNVWFTTNRNAGGSTVGLKSRSHKRKTSVTSARFTQLFDVMIVNFYTTAAQVSLQIKPVFKDCSQAVNMPVTSLPV